MIVLSVNDCPASLRGDLSKWLSEINAGVYVGNLNARVREYLWTRVCENIKDGKATLVYSTNNEQGYAFKVHNTTWEPVDFDGITLIMRPGRSKAYENKRESLQRGFSKASKYRIGKRQSEQESSSKSYKSFVILDLETTGLDPQIHDILEIGLLRIENGEITERYSHLIHQDKTIPKAIVELTGITDQMVCDSGVAIREALLEVSNFINGRVVYGYNVGFDCSFLLKKCEDNGVDYPVGRTKDVLNLARKKIHNLNSYKMEMVADYFSIEIKKIHRALSDCELVYGILNKLNGI